MRTAGPDASSGPAHADAAASAWVIRFAGLIAPGGRVLDVACGRGRHARHLARLGHPVLALDRDRDALDSLSDEQGVEILCADIEGGPWPLEPATFDAVVVTNYLHRPLFPHLIAALRPGGVLLYETFARGNELHGRPSNPAFLLAPGELLQFVAPRLTVVAFEQGTVSAPKPAVIQRVCAIGGETLGYKI